MFIKISQNLQENTWAGVPFLINHRLKLEILLKKRLWQRYFPVNFGKFLRTPTLQNTYGRLLPEYSIDQYTCILYYIVVMLVTLLRKINSKNYITLKYINIL